MLTKHCKIVAKEVREINCEERRIDKTIIHTVRVLSYTRKKKKSQSINQCIHRGKKKKKVNVNYYGLKSS